MEKMGILRSLLRSVRTRSIGVAGAGHRNSLLSHHQPARDFSHLLSPRSSFSAFPHRFSSECGYLSGVGHARYFSVDVVHMPTFEDPKLLRAFKDLMAASWDNLPEPAVYDVKTALSGSTDDKVGKEILENVFRVAEAVEDFGDILTNLRMTIDDCLGLTGEAPMGSKSSEISDALDTVLDRYVAYLAAFGPEENYLRKKVEIELGTKMMHLKMRCLRLGPEWAKISVLGTSGLSGSYVEHRA